MDAYAEHPDQIDLSPYAYVGNNPITRTDPDGNCPPCDVPEDENDFLRYSNQADKNQDYTKAIIHDASVGILDVLGVRDLVRSIEHLGDKNVSTTQKVTRVVVAAVNVMPIDGEGEGGGGGGKYSGLKEPKTVGDGLKTTPAQRGRILEANKKANGGDLRSDISGKKLDPPVQAKKGVKANMNQAEVDHIKERAKGGSNSNSNQRVVSKQENLDRNKKQK